MSHDERRVRTMAGWIGVEISRSRVRTPGKAGYGLYRVRAAAERHWHVPHPKLGPDGEWTAYAFTLDEIGRAVETAIGCGSPAGPQDLGPRDPLTGETVQVPTRWTQAYRGRRDLGERAGRGLCGRPQRHEGGCICLADGDARWLPDDEPVAVRPEYAAQLDALAPLLGAGLVEMVHVDGCSCVNPPERMSAACIRATMPERMAQRAYNDEFQAEHLERRAFGLEARHAAKLARGVRNDGELGPRAR